MDSWLEIARKAEGLTPEDCASAIRCSRPTITSRIKNPGSLSLDELHELDKIFTGDGVKIVHDSIVEALPNFFAS